MNKLTAFLPIIALSAAAGAVQAGGEVAAGKAKAANCTGCHGVDGKGDSENPRIAGLSEDEHLALLELYGSGEREHAMMKLFVDQLTDQDKADIAAYYATLPAE